MSLNFLLGFTGVLSFGHAAYFGLGAYGAAMAIKYIAPSTLLGIARRRRRRDGRGGADRRAHRQAARRLFRDGDDRVRAGVLFHRVSLERGHRRRRRADRLASHAARLRLRHARHLRQRQGVLLFRAGDVRRLRRDHGAAAALAVRAHAARDSRERAPRALPRHPDRAPHLAVVRDFLLVRQRRRRALCAAQQFHRPARAALRSLRQFRHHGGAGRHALVLGAADRRGDFRRAAGLRLQPHRELDVGDRPRLRARRAVLPARRSRRVARRGRRHEPAAGRRRLASVSAAWSPSTASR